jgi:leucyl aminopeptidase
LIAFPTEAKPGAVEAVAFFVATDGPVPSELGVDRATPGACGFSGKVGQSLVLPGGDQAIRVAVGRPGSCPAGWG